MLVLDTRVYGDEGYILAERKDELMFIPEEILTCVVFLGFRLTDKSYRMAGSAFWVVRPMAPDIRENFAYLVTAKHVIQHIKDKGLLQVYVRVNLRDGGTRWIKTELGDWILQDSTDVAAIQLGFTNELEHTGWPITGCADEVLVKSKRVGIGHEVFIAGMFSRRIGNTKNIPIVRVGNIASIPSRTELVQTKLGPMAAYLIEARSIAGISGSPVFIDINGALPALRNRGPSYCLIGLMHGHYDVKEPNDDSTVDDGLQKTSVNMGIAIIIPSEEVIAVIKRFSAKDDQAIANHRRRTAPTMDVADVAETQTTKDGIYIPVPTKDSFIGDLKKASRKKG